MLPIHKIVLPTPFPVGPVNNYLIKSSPLTLLDCGTNIPEAWDALNRALAKLEVRLEEIEQIIITHGHPDHFGMAEKIREISGTEVYIHAPELHKVEPGYSFVTDAKDFLLAGGMPARLVDWLIDVDFTERGDYRIPLRKVQTFSSDHQFKFADLTLNVVQTPGHTYGHVGFFEPAQGIFFSGDHLLKDMRPSLGIEAVPSRENELWQSLKDYLASLKLLKQLPIKIVYPGHGDGFTDVGEVIDNTILRCQERDDQLLRLLTTEKTPYQLTCEVYPKTKGFPIFFAMCTIMAHLEYLWQSGRVEKKSLGGVDLYFSR